MAIILDGTNGISSPDFEMSGVGVTYPLVSGTVATASGTAIDFTGIPSWAKRITVMFSGVSTNGTSVPLIQLGDAGGIENTGYLGTSNSISSAVNATNYTTGFGVGGTSTATFVRSGMFILTNIAANEWVIFGTVAQSDAAQNQLTAGSKSLSATLDRIRITTVNGTDTFDAGTINITYE